MENIPLKADRYIVVDRNETDDAPAYEIRKYFSVRTSIFKDNRGIRMPIYLTPSHKR